MKLYTHQQVFSDYWRNIFSVGILHWSRQSGKTFVSLYEMCNFVNKNDNVTAYGFFYGSSLPWMTEVILDIFERMGLTSKIKNHNVSNIGLRNGSKIKLRNIKSTNVLRGEKVGMIYVDEFNFMKLDILEEILYYKKIIPDVKMIFSATDIEIKKVNIIRDNYGIDGYFIYSNI